MTVLNPLTGVQARSDITAAADRRDRSMMWAHGADGKLRGGVVPGFGTEFATTVSGTTVTVGAGAAILPAPVAGGGGWPLVNDAAWTGQIAARNASNPRVDLVIARVADAFYFTSGDNQAAIEIITGTASASPVVPTVPTAKGAYIILAQLAVPASGNAAAVTVSKNDRANVQRAALVGDTLTAWTVSLSQTYTITMNPAATTGYFAIHGQAIEGFATVATQTTHPGGGGQVIATLPVPHNHPLDGISVLGTFQLQVAGGSWFSGSLVPYASPAIVALRNYDGGYVSGPQLNFDLPAGSQLSLNLRYRIL